MNNYAPIVLFVYNRLWHTQKTVEALQQNELAANSELYVFCDGPKQNASEEQIQKVIEVQDFAQTIKGFKKVHVEISHQNKGLANSIIVGVTSVINQYGKAIILEDDMLTSTHFLKYMNTSLDIYENDLNVACIHGYSIIEDAPIKENTYFQLGADCWGWATWKRAWDLFNPDGSELLRKIENDKKFKKLFTYDGTYDYISMLKNQIEGKIDSWAIRWYASAVVNNMLCLYPRKSLVQNIGFGADATHCQGSDCYEAKILVDETIDDFPRINPIESSIMRKTWKKQFRKMFSKSTLSFSQRIKNKILKLISQKLY